MYSEFRKLFAFIEKELRILFSYRVEFLGSFFQTIFTFIPLVIVGKMFGIERLGILEPYGGNYTHYLLTGVIGWEFLIGIAMGGYMALVDEMSEGTLESILVTPTSIFTIVIAAIISGAFVGLISAGLFIMIGAIFFKVYLTINIHALLIICFSILTMVGLGFIFAGLTLKFKMIGSLFILLQQVVAFGSGVYFPMEVLGPFKYISYLVPTYHSLTGLRIALLPQTSFPLIFKYLIILFLFSVFFFIIGIKTVRWGLLSAKREGSLSWF